MWDFTLPVMNPLRPQAQKLAGNDELSLFTTPTTTQMIASKNICTIWKKQACGTTPSWSSWATTVTACLRPKSKIDDFAIPMIWIGGVIDTTFNQAKTTSQTDLMPTLLAQLGLDARAFTFGKMPYRPGSWMGFLLLTMALGMWIKTMLWCLTMGKRVIEQRGKNPGPTVEVAKRVQQGGVGGLFGG